jgi:hypothetical protein
VKTLKQAGLWVGCAAQRGVAAHRAIEVSKRSWIGASPPRLGISHFSLRRDDAARPRQRPEP